MNKEIDVRLVKGLLEILDEAIRGRFDEDFARIEDTAIDLLHEVATQSEFCDGEYFPHELMVRVMEALDGYRETE